MNHCSPNLSSFKISPWDRGKKWNVTKSHLISKVGGADEIQQTLPSTFPWKLTWTQTLATRQLSQGPDSSEQSCFPRALNTALTVSRQLVQHVNLPALGHHIREQGWQLPPAVAQEGPSVRFHCQPPCLPTRPRPHLRLP